MDLRNKAIRLNLELMGIKIIGITSSPSGGLYKHCLFFFYQHVTLTILKYIAQYNYLTSNLYFAIICRCCTATPLHDSLIYYQATDSVIVLVIIAPTSATGAKAQQKVTPQKKTIQGDTALVPQNGGVAASACGRVPQRRKCKKKLGSANNWPTSG